MQVKVDMDYCADPLWVFVQEGFYANGDLESLQEQIGFSKELESALELWRDQWELYMGPILDRSMNEEGDLVLTEEEETECDRLDRVAMLLGERLKAECPELIVYVFNTLILPASEELH